MVMNRIQIKPIFPMFADRWYTEMGENTFVKKVSGRNYGIGEDGKLIAGARYVVTTPEGLREINNGDWIVYQKTTEGATCRVYTPREFDTAFKKYEAYESTEETKETKN